MIETIDFRNVKYGKVVNNVDITGNGSIGVRIAEIMPDTMPNEAPINPSPSPVSANFEMSEEVFESNVQEQNYIWVEPLQYQAGSQDKAVVNPTQSDSSKKVVNTSVGSQRKYKTYTPGTGPYFVPTIGSVVPCVFVDGDPQQGYWLPFSIRVEGGSATPMTNLEERDDLQLMNRKVNINVVWEAPNGDIFYFDTNDDVNSIVIKQPKGHKFRMESNETVSQIVLSTEKGHKFVLVDKASSEGPGGRFGDNVNIIGGDGDSHVSLITRNGHKIVCDESETPGIQITTSSGIKAHMIEEGDVVEIANTSGVSIKIEGPNMTITTAGTCDINSTGPVTIVSAAKITGSAPSINFNPG